MCCEPSQSFTCFSISLNLWGRGSLTRKMHRKPSRLTVFTRRRSRHGGVVYWIVGCDLLGNQGHYRIIRHLKKGKHMKSEKESRDVPIFHMCTFLIQPIGVGVVFYISPHLFWFHVDKQNILLPLCAAFSPNRTYDDWQGEGVFSWASWRPVWEGMSHGLYSIIPFLKGWRERVWRCEESASMCVCMCVCLCMCVCGGPCVS